jgi:hypothetical protein
VKPGDLVRFRAPHWLWKGATPKRDLSDVPWLIGVVIEYHARGRMVTLYHGEVMRIAERNVQRYGKRYGKGYR